MIYYSCFGFMLIENWISYINYNHLIFNICLTKENIEIAIVILEAEVEVGIKGIILKKIIILMLVFQDLVSHHNLELK